MTYSFDDDFDSSPMQNPADSIESTDVPGHDRSNPLSITQINTVIKGLVDDLVPSVWIAGEVSDVSKPRSGHIYFSLKDDTSVIRAVMWRSTAARMKFELKDGHQVVGLGKIDVYVPRGSYQISFQSLQPQGEGALQLAFRQLHEKLQREGLFEASKKKQLPKFPQRIGFVTSTSGAAIRDFLEMLRSRWPLSDVLIIPATVQGSTAAREIAAGIRLAQKIFPRLDLLVVGRGGGSMEDLWCFNEELVVRAIADCDLPTISAVGHEIDVTLSDLAADVRALTPSDAAIRAVPSLSEIQESLDASENRSNKAMHRILQNLQLQLNRLSERPVLVRPEEVLLRKEQILDELSQRIDRAIGNSLQAKSLRLATQAATVEALSPLKVLGRGYSVTRDAASQRIIRGCDDVKSGQQIETLVPDGSILSIVETTD